MQPMLNHLMAQGRRVIALQLGAAAAAIIGMVFHHLIHPLDQEQLRLRSRVAWLTAALAA